MSLPDIPRNDAEKNNWNEDGTHRITGTKYDVLSFDEDGNDRRGFDKKRIHKTTKEKWDEDGYDYRLFHKHTGKNKFTGTEYDQFNIDQKGFNRQHLYVGISNKKLSTNSFTKNTFYDLNGLDYLGFDKNDFDKDGIHKDTEEKYDENGYDVNGLDKRCFNRNGNYKNTHGLKYDDQGYDQHGVNRDGFDKNNLHLNTKTNFNSRGFDVDGNHKDTFTKFNSKGFDKDDIHKDTGTKYDKNGRDFYGFDADKRDENGRDFNGFDKLGHDKNGFDAMGNHSITGTLYDENDRDWKGNPKNSLNSKSLENIFTNNGYDILHEDSNCIFAKHLDFQNTVFCVKIFSNQFNTVSITESKLSLFLKHANTREEQHIAQIQSSSNFDNLREGSLTDFGWHAELTKNTREKALLEKIISDGVSETLETLNFLYNTWPSKNNFRKELINNVRADIDFVTSLSLSRESDSKNKIDYYRNNLFKKYPKFERDYNIPSLMLIIKINKK